MKVDDVTDTLDLALAASGCDKVKVEHRPRLLSDNVLSAEENGRQTKFLCSSACSRCMTLVKSHRRTRRLPLAWEKVSSIANTGSILLALTVLNTSF